MYMQYISQRLIRGKPKIANGTLGHLKIKNKAKTKTKHNQRKIDKKKYRTQQNTKKKSSKETSCYNRKLKVILTF